MSPQRLICCWIKFRMPSASGSAFCMAGNHLLSFPELTNHHQYHETHCGQHHYFHQWYHLNSNYKHFINIIKIVFIIVQRKQIVNVFKVPFENKPCAKANQMVKEASLHFHYFQWLPSSPIWLPPIVSLKSRSTWFIWTFFSSKDDFSDRFF